MEPPLDVTIHLAFAFDIGSEIDLEVAGRLLPGESPPPARRKRPPESILYRPAPLRTSIDLTGLTLPGGVPAVCIRPVKAVLDARAA